MKEGRLEIDYVSDTETDRPGVWTGVTNKSQRSGWDNFSSTANMGGFDQITALSQYSIQEHFKALRLTSSDLAKWSFEGYFDATFGPVTVRLLSDETALVWIHIEDGSVKSLKDWNPWPE